MLELANLLTSALKPSCVVPKEHPGSDTVYTWQHLLLGWISQRDEQMMRRYSSIHVLLAGASLLPAPLSVEGPGTSGAQTSNHVLSPLNHLRRVQHFDFSRRIRSPPLSESNMGFLWCDHSFVACFHPLISVVLICSSRPSTGPFCFWSLAGYLLTILHSLTLFGLEKSWPLFSIHSFQTAVKLS